VARGRAARIWQRRIRFPARDDAIMRHFAAFALVAAAAGCSGGRIEQNPALYAVGDPAAGAAIIRQAGCGGCHTIPGVRGAKGTVGPPLDSFSRRTYIAGRVPNSPENLTTWILDPPSIDPQTAMPNLELDEAQARAVVAYLYTLK
jgi:cytochrome c1